MYTHSSFLQHVLTQVSVLDLPKDAVLQYLQSQINMYVTLLLDINNQRTR
jgi:hypothetical protein